MILRQARARMPQCMCFIILIACLIIGTRASTGDGLPEFRNCMNICKRENCDDGSPSIPLLHRFLLWDCPAECDYTCQHIITDQRVKSELPIVQFHGKWPFYRFFGMQEPFSVLFSLFNFLAHQNGLANIYATIPESYTLRKYYVRLAYFGMVSWIFSMIFHTRDFAFTEQMDYFAAGASVLYGLYYTPIRIWRLDRGGAKTKSILRAWTTLCIALYTGHVAYLKWYSWDYTYNMAANVVVGVISNTMWSFFSVNKYRKSKRTWAAWPGIVVAWLIVAMSLELLDFPPLWGCLDAHSLWHLGTVAPTILWYNFLLKDAQDDIAGQRLKA